MAEPRATLMRSSPRPCSALSSRRLTNELQLAHKRAAVRLKSTSALPKTNRQRPVLVTTPKWFGAVTHELTMMNQRSDRLVEPLTRARDAQQFLYASHRSFVTRHDAIAVQQRLLDDTLDGLDVAGYLCSCHGTSPPCKRSPSLGISQKNRRLVCRRIAAR